MITVEEAIQLIRQQATRLPPVRASLLSATGLVLAEEVRALVSVPGFHQSAMDGYAIRFNELQLTPTFPVAGEMAAGDAKPLSLPPRCAVRIFTGAPLPQGFDTVVMQEKTSRTENVVTILDPDLMPGSNVRLEGTEVAAGGLALEKGDVLSPAAVGFLASVGITEVFVYPPPVVHVIVTGKELQKPGLPLAHGQVYESNSVMLQAALQQLHIRLVFQTQVTDDLPAIQEKLETALQGADLILLTGGVSVGDYDLVVQAAGACGVEPLFHRVAQRPGKPLYAGKKGNKIIFGLPGNPSSVLSCFYNFVTVAIEQQTGRSNLLPRKKVRLQKPFSKTIALRQFLKAFYTEEGVTPLSAQESFRLSSFSVANCLLDLPEGKKEFVPGDTVEIICLPYL